MSRKPHLSYRRDLFNPESLTSIDAIENALFEFSALLNEHNYETALTNHLDETRVIELVLSGLSESIPLHAWILDHFPDAEQYESSFARKLLLRLAQFVMLHLPVSEDAPILRDHFRSVECAPEALRTLLAMTFLEEEEHTSKWPSSNKKGKTKVHQSKQAKRASQDKFSGNAFLLDLNVSIPENSNELSLTLSLCMAHLKDILQFYLKGLRSPEISSMIQKEFVPQLHPAALRLDVASVTPAGLDQAVPTALMSATNRALSLKKVLELEKPEGFGDWRIIIASNAGGALRQYAQGGGMIFGIILDKLKELSHGYFSDDNHKRLAGPSTDVPLFETKITPNLRLVYQIDCAGSTDATHEIQVLKVFGLYAHNQLEHLWPLVMQQLTKRGREYKRRCQVRSAVGGEDNVFAPVTFLCIEETTDDSSTEPFDNLPGDDYELHKLLSLNKYVTVSKELLKSIWDDRDAAFPFEPSQREREIIEYSNSCYVIGRSGTGKTTAMLFKMLGLERAYQLNKHEGVSPLRQVFVTQSHVLATKVKEQFFEYLESLSVFSHYFQGMRSSGTSSKGADLLAEDDVGDWPVGLPRKYSNLSDEHFPLFVTFDQLCTMIEGDLAYLYGVEKSKQGWKQKTSNAGDALRFVTGRRGSLITFDRFLGEYWSHFPQNLTRKLSASLVFSEILGVISGSEATISSEGNHLDREAYEGLSQQTYCMFSGQRSVIYNIFLAYLKKKNQLGDYDVADRTHGILQAIRQQFFLPPKIDHLYVDETQDNLLVDTLLLRLLCRNPNGMFWAGDTAQTISAGSAFRFDDLKAFLFRFERWKRSMQANKASQYLQTPPKVFHLAINYRSHAGIVNCAYTLVELLMKYWPKTIDKLSRERGEVSGPKPIFYEGIDSNFVKQGHFLSRTTLSTENVEMGAHQCIIVRDDGAKERLRKDLGDIGLILTLYQSKGLEFNDVFLYNFFHDSNVDDPRSWRVVSDASFDASRHAAICFEVPSLLNTCLSLPTEFKLKCLYVAITRARNVVRIADDSLIGEPMRDLWLSRHQIRSCRAEEDVGDFAIKSKKEDWADRARKLFDKKQYEDATMAYKKAGKSFEADVAKAFHERDNASKTPSALQDSRGKGTLRQARYFTAARSFFGCAQGSRDGSKNYYKIAARCFKEANHILKAAETFLLAGCYEEAATNFRSRGKFDEVFNILRDHADSISVAKLEPLKDVLRLYYVGGKQFKKVHQLFDTFEEELEYLGDRNLDAAQVDLYLFLGRKVEAAQVHLDQGRLFEASGLFLADSFDRNKSMRKAKHCILEGLWKTCPFGMPSLLTPEREEYLDKLLAHSELLEEDILNEVESKEIEMFRSIRCGNFDDLPRYADAFLALNHTNAAFFCLDHQFSVFPDFSSVDLSLLCSSLSRFTTYAKLLHDLAFSRDPCNKDPVGKLFGFQRRSQGDFLVPPSSLLFTPSAKLNPPVDGNVTLSETKLAAIFTETLKARLLQRVTDENGAARRTPALSPCFEYIAFRNCHGTSCNLHHVTPDVEWFNTWIRVHLLQIQIYHFIKTVQSPEEMRDQRRYWIRKLHQALHPHHHSFGSISNLEKNANIKSSMHILIDWIRDTAHLLKYDRDSEEQFITTIMQTADLAFTFNKSEASIYMYRSPFINAVGSPRYCFRRPHGENILHDILVAFEKRLPSSLLMGILFIQQVMEEGILIDVNVLCTFIERVCASVVMCRYYQRLNGFHRVMLPRSLIVDFLTGSNPRSVKAQDADAFQLLLQPLRHLLASLVFKGQGSEHLLFDSDLVSTAEQETSYRDVYISRICRSLGLLGYNIEDGPFRDAVHGTLTSIRRENVEYSSQFANYVSAYDFGGIVPVVCLSMGEMSHLDEMVELLDVNRLQSPLHDIVAWRRVTYSSIGNILTLLSAHSAVESSAGVHHQAGFSNVLISEALKGGPKQECIDRDVEDTEGMAALEKTDPDFIPQIELPNEVHTSYNNKEIEAVKVIQRAFRRVSATRGLANKSGLKGGVVRHFLACSRVVQAGQWERSLYKRLFLGPLPHLLSALDVLKLLIGAEKNKLKALLTPSQDNTHHEKLDEVGPSLTRIAYALLHLFNLGFLQLTDSTSATLKGIKNMQETLAPHYYPSKDARINSQKAKRDPDNLKKHVEEAMTLFSNLPCELTKALQNEVARVSKAFLKEPAPSVPRSKKDKRPVLCMEGDHDLHDLETWR